MDFNHSTFFCPIRDFLFPQVQTAKPTKVSDVEAALTPIQISDSVYNILGGATNTSVNPPAVSSTCIAPIRALTGNVSDNPICYNPSTFELTYISGGQAGVLVIDGTFRNVGNALDNNATYMFFAQTDFGDGTYNCSLCWTEEPVVSLIKGNNINLQFVATRQLQVRSDNTVSYNMRWRLVKWIQA